MLQQPLSWQLSAQVVAKPWPRRFPQLVQQMAPKKAAKTEAAEASKGGAKKASKVAKAVKQTISRKVSKVRKNVHFFLPKTLAKKRDPKYVRKSVTRATDKLDKFRIIKYPLTTESAMKKIEEINTLVFIVDIVATQQKVKEAVKALYDVQCAKVNTLVRPDGKKKAYVKLTQE